VQVLCSTGAVTYYPMRADHRRVADARELPAQGFELSIYTNWIDGDEPSATTSPRSGCRSRRRMPRRQSALG
jgi:hypothetical protein